MNNKCISVSIFGDKMYYILSLCSLIKGIITEKIEWDLVINYNDDNTLKLINDVLKNECIDLKENIVFKKHDDYKLITKNSKIDTRGTLWRYKLYFDGPYKYVYTTDVDCNHNYTLNVLKAFEDNIDDTSLFTVLYDDVIFQRISICYDIFSYILCNTEIFRSSENLQNIKDVYSRIMKSENECLYSIDGELLAEIHKKIHGSKKILVKKSDINKSCSIIDLKNNIYDVCLNNLDTQKQIYNLNGVEYDTKRNYNDFFDDGTITNVHIPKKYDLIEKNIFFIWFGDKPNYVDFVVDSFKKVNPTFNVNLIHYTIEEVEKICDIPCGEIKSKIKYDHDYLLNWSFYHIIKNKLPHKNYKGFIQYLSDTYRWVIVNHFGGIYLDCDTFPIKPFDFNLLKLKKFTCTVSDNDTNIGSDGFFFGCKKNCVNNTEMKMLYPMINGYNIPNNLTQKFFNCQLEYGEHYNDIDKCYIEHFSTKTWSKENCKTPQCKYDKYLETL